MERCLYQRDPLETPTFSRASMEGCEELLKRWLPASFLPLSDKLVGSGWPQISSLHCSQWLNDPSRAKIYGVPTC